MLYDIYSNEAGRIVYLETTTSKKKAESIIIRRLLGDEPPEDPHVVRSDGKMFILGINGKLKEIFNKKYE